MRWIKSLGRSFVLLALAIAGPVAFAVIFVSLMVFPTGPRVIVIVRRLPRLARRLAGVSSEGVYWEPPVAIEPEPDGLYRFGNRFVRNPWWYEFERRLDWATDDPGARRDLTWMVANPFVGGALSAAGPGLVGVGIWLLFTPWWPAGIVLGATGVWATPRLLRMHDTWSELMLKAKEDGRMFRFWRWVRLRLKQLWRSFALLSLAVASLLVTVLSLLGGFFMHWFGLWMFAWQPTIESGRVLTNLRRRLIGEWAGVLIPQPYLPQPPPPQRRPDGMYRHGRQLYKTAKSPLMMLRYRRVMTDRATWRDFASGPVDVAVGIIAVPVAIVAAPWALRLQAKASRFLLAPTQAALLAQRVRELTETRADATDTQAAELRRIERDLHDGAQARLVALGLTLGAVERLIDQDPQLAKSLVAKSKAASAEALVELRDLVRGIHPPVLAERGLLDAIRAVALDSPLHVTVLGELSGRPEAPVESAAYFAVCELLVNAVKHSHAERITVDVQRDTGGLYISVTDDGRGGADPDKGTGLQGLRRRLATFDGTLHLISPRGGPTVATMHIPQ